MPLFTSSLIAQFVERKYFDRKASLNVAGPIPLPATTYLQLETHNQKIEAYNKIRIYWFQTSVSSLD